MITNAKSININGKAVKTLSINGKQIWSKSAPTVDYEILSDGTWEIYTEQGMIYFKEQVETVNASTNAILANDITLTKDWYPIGFKEGFTEYVKYTGTFNGNGYAINNLTITEATTPTLEDTYLYPQGLAYSGLFCNISGSSATHVSVVNLTLNNVNLSQPDRDVYAGGIAGYVSTCTIERVIVNSGNVGSKAAPIIARVDASFIIACENHCDVTATVSMGGILSQANYTTQIIGCINTGNIVGTNVGNLVGFMAYGSTIVGSYGTGTLNGTTVGGMTAYISNGGSVSSSYYINTNSYTATTGTRLANVEALNGVVGTMNTATQSKGYIYVAGADPTTDLPTIVET